MILRKENVWVNGQILPSFIASGAFSQQTEDGLHLNFNRNLPALLFQDG